MVREDLVDRQRPEEREGKNPADIWGYRVEEEEGTSAKALVSAY
jgi:hypothetical protein